MSNLVSLRRSACAVVVLLAFGLSGVIFAATPQTVAAPAVPNTIQQRLAACTSCHGAHGEGSADSVLIPGLAGKPAGYLLQQLEYFQSGQRQYAPMEYVVRQLSTTYLRQIVEYFSSQDVPYHQQPVPAVSVQTMRRGEQLVLHGDPEHAVPACVSCHGARLAGVQPMMPGLAGLSYDYIYAQLMAWRSHVRAAEGPYCMGVVANRMRESDITAVAAWLASQKLPADMHPQPASAQTASLPGWCVMGKSGVNP